MKRLALILSLILVLFTVVITVPVIAADTTMVKDVPENVSTQIVTSFWDGVIEFWGMLDMLFIVTFIILSSGLNFYSLAENKASWLNFLRKVPTTIWVLIFGFIIAILFWALLDRYNSREDVMGLIMSIFVSMIIYKIGINRLLQWAFQKFLKIEIGK